MNISAVFMAILLLPLGALADEVQCTDIPKEELKYDYDLYEDGGTLELTVPEKYEEATFSTFRINFGIENKHSFWVETKQVIDGQLQALVGVPNNHERLSIQVVYHYPNCFALLKAQFENGLRIE